MSTDSARFIDYGSKLVSIAHRLKQRDVSIYHQNSSHDPFGGWSIVAGADRERFRFEWDGRSLTFTISVISCGHGKPEWVAL